MKFVLAESKKNSRTLKMCTISTIFKEIEYNLFTVKHCSKQYAS